MVEGADHIAAIRARLVSGVRPPVTGRFTRQRNQSRDEHEELDRRPITDEGRRENAGRLRDHDQLAPVADRLEHGVGVVGQPCRVVVARQVRRHRVMTPATQLGLHQMPVPADVAGAMDEDEGGHLGSLPVAKVDEPTRESPLVEQLEIDPDSVRESPLPAADQDRCQEQLVLVDEPRPDRLAREARRRQSSRSRSDVRLELTDGLCRTRA